MYKKVSRSNEIDDRLKKEGKIRTLDSAEDLVKITSMNKFMEGVRKEYQIKESRSHISAANIVLNS